MTTYKYASDSMSEYFWKYKICQENWCKLGVWNNCSQIDVSQKVAKLNFFSSVTPFCYKMENISNSCNIWPVYCNIIMPCRNFCWDPRQSLDGSCRVGRGTPILEDIHFVPSISKSKLRLIHKFRAAFVQLFYNR